MQASISSPSVVRPATITVGPRGRVSRRILTGLSWFVAFELFLFAPFKFYPGGLFDYPSYAEKFVNWGYPAWFAIVIGGAELLSAVLLLMPSRRFLGAVLLVFILTGAVATHIINKDTIGDSIAAPIHLVLGLVVALAYWPADWRDPFRRRAAAVSVHSVSSI
jgi:uncharacterized membrane protein YphA (DoxX/SURF4 family)